jgi:AcrR family transcriptional regulator
MGRRPLVSRDEVLEAARRTFVERGYSAATLASIAAALGVSPAALLRHAPDKASLFAAAMAPQGEEPFPLEFLKSAATADPAAVLRRVGETLVPFIEAKLGQTISLWMHAKAGETGAPLLPFDPSAPDSPPRRVLGLVEDYLRRARRARTLDLEDTHAAAVAFMATLHSYVFLKHVVQIVDASLPLDRYLDTVVDVWTRDARKGRVPRPRVARRKRTR